MDSAKVDIVAQLRQGWLARTREYALLFVDLGGTIVGTAGNVEGVLGYPDGELVGEPGSHSRVWLMRGTLR
jgi:hypothetical protein